MVVSTQLMRRAVAAVLLACPVFSGTATAQDPPALAGTDCTALLAAADAGLIAAFQPGVDVRGRPVAPADLQPGVDVRGRPVAPAGIGPVIALPGEIVIPVQPRIFDFLKITPPRGLGDLRAGLGELRLSNGRLTFNGQPIGSNAVAALIEACCAAAAADDHVGPDAVQVPQGAAGAPLPRPGP